MEKYNKKLGYIGETIAKQYLEQKKFKIIDSNFYSKWGEIDIIAKTKDRLHFIEVKTRTNLKYGRPEEAITRFKYTRTKRAMIIYLRQNKLSNTPYQIDALAILYDPLTNKANIRYFPNIFY